MDFQTFVIIDPDSISCYLAKSAILGCYPQAEIKFYNSIPEAMEILASENESCCILIENTVLHLGAKQLMTILKDLALKNFRVIILSNAFQKKLLSIIPQLYHVRFTYKPITKKKLKELIEEW